MNRKDALTSRLDYNNMLYVGLAMKTVWKLVLVAADRLLTKWLIGTETIYSFFLHSIQGAGILKL